MENSQIARKTVLEKALSDKGLTLRMDSKLCYCYVNGQTGPEWDVQRVVHECSVMYWLYNFTNYQQRCEYATINESRLHYFRSQRDLLSYMRKYIHPIIKESIIRENRGLPEVWPWLVTPNTESMVQEVVEEGVQKVAHEVVEEGVQKVAHEVVEEGVQKVIQEHK